MSKHLIHNIPRLRLRIIFALTVIAVTPLGFATKFYHGVGETWVRLYAGDILYPVFWYFLFLTFFPRFNPYILAGLNLAFDCLGECTQLLHTPLLESIRSTFIGRTVIGNGFDSNDFYYYLIGNIFAVMVYRSMIALISSRNGDAVK